MLTTIVMSGLILTFAQYCEKRNLSGQKEIAQGRKSFDRATSEGWWEPNTVDVHSVKKIQNLDAYLVKYFLQNDVSRRLYRGKTSGLFQNHCQSLKVPLKLFAEI